MGTIINAELKITLKSDLCVSSGYSYSGIIDSDICYDSYGLPYIPARRLKGCFKDTAKMLYGMDLPGIFGKTADSSGGSFIISNARLENYDDIKKEIEEMRGLISPQDILAQFTRVIGQTKLNDGVADSGSLRYTRVVNRYSPINQKENVFIAEVSYNEDDFETLKKVVASTKNIGLKRNRGFGAVKCDLFKANKGKESDNKSPIADAEYDTKAAKQCVIEYTFVNDEPLVLSAMKGVDTESHIRGQAVLGLLAGKYIRRMSLNNEELDAEEIGESDAFKDLFLNGTTIFTDAFPTISAGDKNTVLYPAPSYINRTKKTKKYINMAKKNSGSQLEPGDTPKKLRGKYVVLPCVEPDAGFGKTKVHSVSKKLHYHHRKEEELLYPIEALESGQYFTGRIYTTEKYADTLLDLLEGDLYFGKSKTAQYGKCHVITMTKKEQSVARLEELPKNTEGEKAEVVLTLLSDAIFMKDCVNTVKVQDIQSILSDFKESEDSIFEAMMETGLISGYQAKWNLHKSLTPVVKAGSAFRFLLDEVAIPSDGYVFVGQRNLEGYGFARIDKVDSMIYALDKMTVGNQNEDSQELLQKKSDTELSLDAFVLCKDMFSEILMDKVLDNLLETKISHKTNILKSLNNTQIGRVTLMLEESIVENNTPDDVFRNFEERVTSIKTISFREKVKGELITPFKKNGKLNLEEWISGQKKNQDIIEQSKHLSVLEKTKDRNYCFNSLWSSYVLKLLINRKYTGAMEGKDE